MWLSVYLIKKTLNEQADSMPTGTRAMDLKLTSSFFFEKRADVTLFCSGATLDGNSNVRIERRNIRVERNVMLMCRCWRWGQTRGGRPSWVTISILSFFYRKENGEQKHTIQILFIQHQVQVYIDCPDTRKRQHWMLDPKKKESAEPIAGELTTQQRSIPVLMFNLS